MNTWLWVYDSYEPENEGLREALCALGNGYFATRGAACESHADGIQYPGTYLAGGYNRLKTQIAGNVIQNEDLVNLPNWLQCTFRIDAGEWFDLRKVDIISYRQELNLLEGILTRTIRFLDREQRETTFSECRFVSMENPHLAAQKITITPHNWSGKIEACTNFDINVINSGVKRYRGLSNKHLVVVETEPDYVKVQFCQSKLYVAMAKKVVHTEGVPFEIEKVVSLYTSRDKAISECGLQAKKEVQIVGDFNLLRKNHIRTWKALWGRFDIEIEPSHVQQILRLHIFHLLQTASLHTMDLDVGIPARGLHGEAYRGHVFWDELFVFPFLNYRVPEITRSLLFYRYRRLPQACTRAQEAGYKGAMYPWQSGSSGAEESQKLHLNPLSERWIEDNTFLQRHVNTSIVYNVWNYYKVTNDLEFLSFYGAEMILQIACFWSSYTTYNESLDRYEILNVMGPDEYHDKPVNNNTYTNVSVVWTFCRALDVLKILPKRRLKELSEKLNLHPDELHRWDEISRKMRVIFHQNGIVSQFEGYEELREFDWEGYRKKYGDIQRLDRILENENDSVNHYKISKQADVVMLFYLFSAPELHEIFTRLGYPFNRETIPINTNYYIQRTSHGSTLSRIVHSWVLARTDRAHSWQLFSEALLSDVSDIQGGTTKEGIHLGAMATTLDMIQRGYMGLEVQDSVLVINPLFPDEIKSLKITLYFRGSELSLKLADKCLNITSAGPVSIGHQGKVYAIDCNKSLSLSILNHH